MNFGRIARSYASRHFRPSRMYRVCSQVPVLNTRRISRAFVRIIISDYKLERLSGGVSLAVRALSSLPGLFNRLFLSLRSQLVRLEGISADVCDPSLSSLSG